MTDSKQQSTPSDQLQSLSLNTAPGAEPKRGRGRPRKEKPEAQKMYEELKAKFDNQEAQLKQTEERLATTQERLHRTLNPFEWKCPEGEIKQYEAVIQELVRVSEGVDSLLNVGEQLGMKPTPGLVLPQDPTDRGVASELKVTQNFYLEKWRKPLVAMDQVLSQLYKDFQTLTAKKFYNAALQNKVNILQDQKQSAQAARQREARKREEWQQHVIVGNPHFQRAIFRDVKESTASRARAASAPAAPATRTTPIDLRDYDDQVSAARTAPTVPTRMDVEEDDEEGEDLGGDAEEEADRQEDERAAAANGEERPFARDANYSES